ncbi:unnamed protein product [Pleuronectes platessa]|uniref:Uncharacterized protein n=1 Tax=Pleuronectes platessa TaxID=8262 RepID=A0A9N7VBP1_PLEPL|nr:unnamed protein product [Pleuronectes platessa]
MIYIRKIFISKGGEDTNSHDPILLQHLIKLEPEPLPTPCQASRSQWDLALAPEMHDGAREAESRKEAEGGIKVKRGFTGIERTGEEEEIAEGERAEGKRKKKRVGGKRERKGKK